MGKYTPGPWTIQNVKSDFAKFVGTDKQGFFTCARVSGSDNANVEANARLIAASPDAIEACQDALKLLRGSGFTENAPTIQKLKAVLEKAGV